MIKVNVHLVQAIAKEKAHNNFRYYLAMHLSDTKRTGKVNTKLYIATITQKFNLKEKTVQKMLQQLANEGWITLAPNYIYYKSIDKITQKFTIDVVNRVAVWVDWADIKTIKSIRAFCHATTLTNKTNEKTISRATISKLTNTSRQTQRKYEQHVGIEKRANYAILGEYNGNKSNWQDHAYRENDLTGAANSVFVGNSPTKPSQSYVMRQIPNTYYTNLRFGKRRFDYPDLSCKKKGKYQKRYYQNGHKNIISSGRSYIQDKKYANLWFSKDE